MNWSGPSPNKLLIGEKRMRVFAGVLIASVAFAGAAFASDLSGVVGHTLSITTAEGVVANTVAVNADNTYSATPAEGEAATGTWAIAEDGSEACFTADNPAEGQEPICTADILGKGVGDSWTATNTDAEGVEVSSTVTVVE
jgi:hypothetical protein